MKYSTLANLAAFAASTVMADSSSYNSRTYSTVNPSATEIAETAKTAKTNHITSNVKGAAFNRFITIWLENTDYDKAAEDGSLSWLATQGIILDNYWALTHPSEPNYLAAVGGDYFSLDDDRFISMPANVSTIVDLLDTKNISWGEYQEHMPYTGYQGFNYSNQETFANDYVRKHNPLILYESITNDADRLANIKNFTEFYVDLNGTTLPQYSFITPNMTNDGHDTTIKVAGQWSRDFLEPLLSNEYFMNDTLVVLTFDENDTYSVKNKIFTILLGGVIPDELKGTTDSTFYDHYSLISSVEANWDLPSLGRHDATANVFQIVANATNITNKEVDTTYMVNNETYIGYLKDDTIALPAPNVSIINMNGKGVLSDIVKTWSSEYSAQVSDSYFTSTTTTVSQSLTDVATLVSGTGTTLTESVTSASAAATSAVSKDNSTNTSSSSSKAAAGAVSVDLKWTSLAAMIAGLIFF